VNEGEIRRFWDAHPVGEQLSGALAGDYEQFFEHYDQYRYRTEGHILRRFDGMDLEGRELLEIGVGQGADTEQLIRRGALWNGIDLSGEAVDRVRARLRLRALPFNSLTHGSVTALPYAGESFDTVFSHGVLHHVPDIDAAQREIARVLRPDGRLVVMLYAKQSLNYWLSIWFLRRVALSATYAMPGRFGDRHREHVENARRVGLRSYLRMRNFVHRNTDGPANTYTKVYSNRDVASDFRDFDVVDVGQEFMHAPPLPVSRLPLAGRLGWHLWAELRPRKRRGDN
jgi:ubiquinone/menaquinone biosynthesis C-methylase UbiE